jgi:VanZ family protein
MRSVVVLESWLVGSLLVAGLALGPVMLAGAFAILWRSRTRSWREASVPVVRTLAIPIAVVGLLVFALRPNQFPVSDMYVNLEPFRDLRTSLEAGSLVDIALKNVLGNAAMFVPLGAAAALAFPNTRVLAILGTTVALSAAIEVVQTLPVISRSADVTDVIMNAVGAVLGFVVIRRTIRTVGRRAHSGEMAAAGAMPPTRGGPTNEMRRLSASASSGR